MTNNLLHNLDRLQHDQQTENQRLRNKVATLQTQLADTKEALDFEREYNQEHYVTLIETLTNELKEANQRSTTLQTENETLQAAVQFEQNQKAKAREQRDAVAKQLTEATQRIAELEQERDEYKSLFLSEFNND